MARLRLRLLVQEFDLKGPEVLIGRSPSCHLTIEDPMVSRVHARIRIDEDRAFLSDMKSRNGVRVNGRKISGERELQDTDRIRIGTREMVFSVIGKEERLSRTTGYLRMCERCGTPFPDESVQCPHCGHTVARDEDTVSGMVAGNSQGWTVDLFCDVIARAIEKERLDDATRMMTRLRFEIHERAAGGYRVAARDLSNIAKVVVQVVNANGESEWLSWLLELCRTHSTLPGSDIARRLEHVDVARHPELQGSVEALRTYIGEVETLEGEETDAEARRPSGTFKTPLVDVG